MRILHTADWHIGQTLNGWSRETEHRAFLAHLGEILLAEQVDALLVAGDVFDGLNPSGEAQRLLYAALAGYVRANPRLQIVLTSGNHDPAQRLEAPEAVLRELGVHVLGTLTRGAEGVDLGRHLIPLRDRAGQVRAQVLALPFLRQADLPGLRLGAEEGTEGAVTGALRALLTETVARAQALAGAVPLIAMAHLTCAGGLESAGAERRILIGGDHAVPPEVFPPALAYVALGHLHRPQSLDGGRVRYSGSPFPLSASEIGYDHGVTLLDLATGAAPRHIPLPRPVPVLRLPAAGTAPLPEILAALGALPPGDTPRAEAPFLYLALAADRPVTEITAALDAALEPFPLRLAGLTITRPETGTPAAPLPQGLSQTTPEALFAMAFRDLHGADPEARHLGAFRDALSEV
ncbi:exonuclease subunit SbcD [Rhodobacter capsulatus]|uniref:Nuclease SbcCD subunit D n=1 Tax=Rhodobacter capsulatus TaxID=1061 RepID=A0A4U1JN27_RHOCA|nr:exonuclease subunit SbcD [Rhodobacter capsulatus]TKD15631.1 exonuclease subunit SbcD [Rhodobacter capsulatus]